MPSLATAKKPRKSAGRPVNSDINKGRIVDVALEQIDRVGIHAFSLRDLARALDVYPSTVYWHVESRDGLLAEVAARVMSDIVPPVRPKSDWRTWMRQLFVRYRKAVQKHPNVAQLIGAQLVSNASLPVGLIEGVLDVLLAAGATERNLRDAYNCVISAMIGFTTMELAPLPPDDPDGWAGLLEARVRTLDPLAYPTLARHLPMLANRAFIVRWQNGSTVALDSSFEANVKIFIMGLEAYLGALKSPAPD